MPSISVYPGNESKTHDVSLSDASTQIGLIYDQNTPRVLQEIPVSDPARPFAAQQKNWTGGGMRLRYQDDPMGFYDSYAMWTMTDGKMFPMPQWKFGTGYRDADMLFPGDVKFENLYQHTYISVKFTAGANYNADKALFWLDWNGAPGALTVKLCPDSGGDPDYAGALKSATLNVSSATRHGPNELDWTTTEALTASTDYHLVFEATGQDSQNYWRVATDASGSASQTSTDASTWSAASFSAYYRVLDADNKRQFHIFDFRGATYAIGRNNNEGNSTLWINGDRGKITTGGSGTTFSDSTSGVSSGWTTDQWAGWKVRIIDGKGDGLWRTIASNTSTQITTTTSWNVTLDTTSQYVIYDGPSWQEITGHGLGYVTGKPVVIANDWQFAVPQGQNDNIRKIKIDYTQGNNHNFADDGTNKADLLGTSNNPKAGLQVWASNNNTAQVSYASSVAFASTMSFTTMQIGSYANRVTNLVSSSSLRVMKDDSVWVISDTYLPSRLESGLDTAIDRDNGVAAFTAGGDLWFGWNHSIAKTEGQSIRDLLNFRVGSQGLLRGGIPRDGISAMGWKFFAFDSEGASGTRSSIQAFNGLGWQEIFRGWNADARIKNIFWQTNPGGRSKLWCDVNGDLVYIEFPQYAANPLLDSTLPHQHYAEWISGTFDGNDITLAKLLGDIRLVAENDESGDWEIIVEFQINKDVGTDTWYRAGSLKNLATDEFELDLGEVYEWRIRLRFYTEDADSPAVLNSYAIEGEIGETTRYQWVGVFRVDPNLPDYQGNEDFDPDDVREFLLAAADKKKSIRMRSMIESMDMKTVTVIAPVVERNYVLQEDGKQKWGGRIQVAFREP